jgi:hypothetical protein
MGQPLKTHVRAHMFEKLQLRLLAHCFIPEPTDVIIVRVVSAEVGVISLLLR